MNCERAREDLGPYVDGELPTAARDRLEAHLTACAPCRAELESVRAVASDLAAPAHVPVPDALWPAILSRLDHGPPLETRAMPSRGFRSAARRIQVFRAPWAMAAAVVLAVGLGMFGLVRMDSQAQASTVNFGILLDALPLDAEKAFRKFLVLYDAKESSPVEAKRYAPDLTFDVPEDLPGGFRMKAVYLLRFGSSPGVAATYRRDGEFLGTIFHAPVQQEDFGTHKDYPCVIGQHRGHKVQVGPWTLVHRTDPTTCHCVLSRLNEQTELPEVMAAVAPGSVPDDGEHHLP